MKPVFRNGSVSAQCPDCGGATSFENSEQTKAFGSIARNGRRVVDSTIFHRTIYTLLRCATCQRGGLAEILANNTLSDGHIFDFYPHAPVTATVPQAVPGDIVA